MGLLSSSEGRRERCDAGHRSSWFLMAGVDDSLLVFLSAGGQALIFR